NSAAPQPSTLSLHDALPIYLTPNYFSPFSNIQGSYSGTYNPVAMANSAINKILQERIIPKFYIRYSIIPRRLVATVDVQFDMSRSEEHTSELQSRENLVCRL